MRYLWYLTVFITVAIQFYCNSPEVEKNRPGVKYLHVTADIPDDLLVKVRSYFKSIPTCWGCKSLSEQSWNWVPLEYSDIYYFSRENKEICAPLFIDKSTVCKWIYYETQIFVARKDSFEITGFGIYPTVDTTLSLKYAELVDTIQYTCYKCVNQYMLPPDNDIFIKCDQIGRDEEDPIDYYTYDFIRGDTANVTIVARHDNGPIRYMDTTLTGINLFRVFGKDEKIPGLNEENRK